MIEIRCSECGEVVPCKPLEGAYIPTTGIFYCPECFSKDCNIITRLKELVREIGNVKFNGRFGSYYDQLYEILSRPEVRAILEEK